MLIVRNRLTGGERSIRIRMRDMLCAVQAMLSPSAKAKMQSKQRDIAEPQLEDAPSPVTLPAPMSIQGETQHLQHELILAFCTMAPSAELDA